MKLHVQELVWEYRYKLIVRRVFFILETFCLSSYSVIITCRDKLYVLFINFINGGMIYRE